MLSRHRRAQRRVSLRIASRTSFRSSKTAAEIRLTLSADSRGRSEVQRALPASLTPTTITPKVATGKAIWASAPGKLPNIKQIRFMARSAHLTWLACTSLTVVVPRTGVSDETARLERRPRYLFRVKREPIVLRSLTTRSRHAVARNRATSRTSVSEHAPATLARDATRACAALRAPKKEKPWPTRRSSQSRMTRRSSI